MTVFYTLLLAAEQIGQAMGVYPIIVYHLFALTEGYSWVSQLLVWIFDTWSLPLACIPIFAPYMYLVFGTKDVPQ